MSKTTTPSLSYRFSPRATLAALGIRLQGLHLFGPVRAQVHMNQKTITHTPVQKGSSPNLRPVSEVDNKRLRAAY